MSANTKYKWPDLCRMIFRIAWRSSVRSKQIRPMDFEEITMLVLLTNIDCIKEICNITGLSENTISRWATSLHRRGYIKLRENWKRGHSPKYRWLRFSELPAKVDKQS